MGANRHLAFHVSHPSHRFSSRDIADQYRLATTSLIIARRAVASANGNPEFDAALVSS